MAKLIIIRGNSGSGKSSLAENLQRRFGKDTMRIPQDMIRREMLAVKDGINNPAIHLIKELIVYGAKHQRIVIVEGILKKEWYGELFHEVIPLFDEIYSYYYDLPFEETIRRHQYKQNKEDFTAEDMKHWWNENDRLDIKGEEIIGKNRSLEEISTQIYENVTKSKSIGSDWKTCPQNVRRFVCKLKKEIPKLLEGNMVGIYLHGSLAMGGFHPKKSDIDIIVVTSTAISSQLQERLAMYFLENSNRYYPIEISFLHKKQLTPWHHPCAYDFHYSEEWREIFSGKLSQETTDDFEKAPKTDGDLAAHFTIINKRGICLSGEPIRQVFPKIPKVDYFDSINSDYEECLEEIYNKPVYCVLNMLRVYFYVRDEKISSKLEASEWGIKNLPERLQLTIEKAKKHYEGNEKTIFERKELAHYKNFIDGRVQNLMKEKSINDKN